MNQALSAMLGATKWLGASKVPANPNGATAASVRIVRRLHPILGATSSVRPIASAAQIGDDRQMNDDLEVVLERGSRTTRQIATRPALSRCRATISLCSRK
jgi:hypothetical protein